MPQEFFKSQHYVTNLSHVTGKAAKARNRAIQAVIIENLPNLRLTYVPLYNPFIRTAIAKQGWGTQIGKTQFCSRIDLLDAIVHEELHHRWWKRNISSPHHAVRYEPNERFYEVIRRYKRLRGWKE